MKTPRIVLIMKSGLVVEALSNQSGLDLLILDQDTDGVDEDDVQEVRHNRVDMKVRVENPDVAHKAVATDSLFNQVTV